MAGLNLEFHQNQYSLCSEKNRKSRHPMGRLEEVVFRVYKVPFDANTVYYLRTASEQNEKEKFNGLFTDFPTVVFDALDPIAREVGAKRISMKGYVGAHRREDGVLSIGTPYHSASLTLMELSVTATESEMCYLRLDSDGDKLLEDRKRIDIYKRLQRLVITQGVGVVKKNGRYSLYRLPGGTVRSKRIKRLLEQALRNIKVPQNADNDQPLVPGTAFSMYYADAFRQHFLKTVRGSGDFLKLAAETALGKWNAAIGNHDGGRIKLNPDN